MLSKKTLEPLYRNLNQARHDNGKQLSLFPSDIDCSEYWNLSETGETLNAYLDIPYEIFTPVALAEIIDKQTPEQKLKSIPNRNLWHAHHILKTDNNDIMLSRYVLWAIAKAYATKPDTAFLRTYGLFPQMCFEQTYKQANQIEGLRIRKDVITPLNKQISGIVYKLKDDAYHISFNYIHTKLFGPTEIYKEKYNEPKFSFPDHMNTQLITLYADALEDIVINMRSRLKPNGDDFKTYINRATSNLLSEMSKKKMGLPGNNLNPFTYDYIEKRLHNIEKEFINSNTKAR